MDEGSIRDIERLREEEDGRTPRSVTLLFVALGAACLVLAVLSWTGRASKPEGAKLDPLAQLVAEKNAAPAPSVRPTDLSPRDVTFPGILSDRDRPTTALAAVRGAPSASSSIEVLPPPPAADRLPVVPLPAQNVLQASPVVTRPRDGLTKAATDAAQLATAPAPAASAGRDGGYQLQISSFRTQGEAQAFADQLRARGHRAYVAEARVPGRGTWYRVRIGPFATQAQAATYRSGFEAKEHVVPFIVPPPAPSTK
jgi:cell division septation protein DedD